MKTTIRTLSVLLAAFGLTLAAQSSMAATTDHTITEAQLSNIHNGQAISQVTRTLGEPESLTHWFGGKQSIVYELPTPVAEQQLVYINFDNRNKVTGVQVINRD